MVLPIITCSVYNDFRNALDELYVILLLCDQFIERIVLASGLTENTIQDSGHRTKTSAKQMMTMMMMMIRMMRWWWWWWWWYDADDDDDDDDDVDDDGAGGEEEEKEDDDDEE